MTWVRWALVIYGIALIGIGAYGAFGPAKSMISLVASGVAGALVLVGVGLSLKYFRWGYALAGLVALGMIGRFFRGALEGDLYPSQVVVGISVLAIAVMAVGHFAAQKKPASPA